MAVNGQVEKAAADELAGYKIEAQKQNEKYLAAKRLEKWYSSISKDPNFSYSVDEVKKDIVTIYDGNTTVANKAFKDGKFNDYDVFQDYSVSDSFTRKKEEAKQKYDDNISKAADINTSLSVPDTIDHNVTFEDIRQAEATNKSIDGDVKGKIYMKVDKDGNVVEKITANSDYSAKKLKEMGYTEATTQIPKEEAARLGLPIESEYYDTLSFKTNTNSSNAYEEYKKALEEKYPTFKKKIEVGNDGEKVTTLVDDRSDDFKKYNDKEFFKDVYEKSYKVKTLDEVPDGKYYMTEKDGYRVIKDEQVTNQAHNKLLSEAGKDPNNTMFNYKPKVETKTEDTKDKDLKKPDEEKKPEEKSAVYSADQHGKLVIANKEIAYVRANGSTKIKYPITTEYVDVMGLPPLYIDDSMIHSDKIIPLYTSYVDDNSIARQESEYRYYDQMVGSFPILKIHPIDIEILRSGVRTKSGNTKLRDTNSEDKNYRGHVLSEVEYKFAVQTSSTIQYSHTNQFGESGVENSLKKVANTFASMSQIQNLADAMGGSNNKLVNQVASLSKDIGSKLQSQAKDWQNLANNSDLAKEHSDIMGVLNTALNAGLDLASGGRIDLPDVWLDSSTSNTHNFTIELRTLSPDPSSNRYFADILLPLYILLTLALPTEGQSFLYKTPTYISATLDDSFWEVKFGAITSLQWTIDTNYINFKKVPTHITVNLTIQDMYKLMPQGVYDEDNSSHTKDHNKDMITKDTYINNFVNNFPSPKSRKIEVPNEAYYLTEFSALAAYQKALDKLKAKKKAQDDEDKMDLSENGWHYPSMVNKMWDLNLNGDQLGVDTPLPDGVERAVALDKKTNSFATSIDNVITGVTTGIKNITAGVNKAIAPVKEIISKGKAVMNTFNNLKASIKTIGKTANIEGILNGSFTTAIGGAFNNLGNATSALSDLTGGVFTNTQFGKNLLGGISNIAQTAMSFDLPSIVSDNGNSFNLLDQVKTGISTVRAFGSTAKALMNTVAAAKSLVNSSTSNPLDKFSNYVDAVGVLADGADYADRLLAATKQSAIDSQCYTAGQLASNAKLQEKMRDTTAAVANDAAELTKKIAKDGTLDYLKRQDWFKDNFSLRSGTNGTNFSDYTLVNPSSASILSDKFDNAWSNIANSTATLAGISGNVTRDATMAGIANTSGVDSAVVITSNS